jgi:hypothetical protein
MVEVQVGEAVYLNEYTEYDRYTLAELVKHLEDRMVDAEDAGFEGVYVQFRSTLEPYEDCSCGPVEVQIRGNRPYDRREVLELKKQEAIEALAKELGVTFYEASVIKNLKERGKI